MLFSVKYDKIIKPSKFILCTNISITSEGEFFVISSNALVNMLFSEFRSKKLFLLLFIIKLIQ